MPEIEKSAESVEEAIEAALAELGVSEQEAHIEILQEDRSGFLGLKPQPAVVRVRTLASPGAAVAPPTEESRASAAEFIKGLFQAMGLEAEVEVAETDGVTYIEVWAGDDGEDLAVLIGRHGHTLDSLQELMRNHVQQRTGERSHVLLDVEDYRKRQRSRIERQAHLNQAGGLREAAEMVRQAEDVDRAAARASQHGDQ